MVVKSGSVFCFDYTAFDPVAVGLFVAANIYDMTSGSAVFVSQAPMSHVANGVYSGTFTPVDAKTYLIHKLVFTDGTYSTIDTDRSPGTTTVQSVTFKSGGSSGGNPTLISKAPITAMLTNQNNKTVLIVKENEEVL